MTSEIPAGFERLSSGPGFAEAFGLIFVRRSTNTLAFRVAVKHVNPVNVCNGGAIATFADMRIAAVLAAGPGTREGHQPTVSLNLDFVAPAPLGAWIEAAVSLIKTTRTLIFTQALITVDGKIVARSSAIYRNRNAVRDSHSSDRRS
jgi:acyl-coenzyme A thioesterase PaaI-like protein